MTPPSKPLPSVPTGSTLLVTQAERLYLPIAIGHFCQKFGSEVAALIVLPSFNEGLASNIKRFAKFYGVWGTSRLASQVLWALVLDRVNRIFGPHTRPYSVEEAASRHGVRILHVEDINSPETVAWLTSIRPKMMVSVAASQIFRSEVLEIPELGCINLHSSPLPKYRGMMPNFWAMWHGDTRTCVTVHRMVPKLDAGEIILQKEVPIHPHDTLHDLMQRSKVIGGQALVEAAEIITAGIAQPRPLNLEEGSYFHFPTRGDAKKLRKLGHRLI